MGDEIYAKWGNDDCVAIFHFLNDIKQPYSCTQWGDFGDADIPPIVDDERIEDGSGYAIFDWFENPNGAAGIASLIVFIDHTMEIIDIMASSPSFNMANIKIDDMLDSIPVDLEGCIDESACNYNSCATMDDGSCLENDCASVCGGSAVVDVCGICSGSETDANNCLGIHYDITVAKQFYIQRLYPNPFNPVLNINFGMSWAGVTQVNILDIAGSHIETLYFGFLQIGSHEMSWNAESMHSGIYFISLKSGDKSLTEKVVLLK